MRTALVSTLIIAALVSGCGGQSDSTPAAGSGTGTADGPADAQTFTIAGTDADAYDPATVQAKVGKLTLTLRTGGVPHDLTFDDKTLPGIPVVNSGETKSTALTFAKPGTFTFMCTLHPGMAGKVVVA